VREAPDDQIVRINPIQYAADHGRDEAQVIDLFLNARKAGLLTMEWLYVCRGCGRIIESFHTLNAAGEHSFCKTCLVKRDADLSDFVEIAFTVSKAVRTSRFHDPTYLLVRWRGTARKHAIFIGVTTCSSPMSSPAKARRSRSTWSLDFSVYTTVRSLSWSPHRTIALSGSISHIVMGGRARRCRQWRRDR
jgi:hypothetical protein